MKKENNVNRIILIGLFMFFVLVICNNIFASPTFSLSIPSSCSDTSIKATWDSLFEETSEGINFTSNTSESSRCNSFMAYKLKDGYFYILTGMVLSNSTRIAASKMNTTEFYISNVQNFKSFSSGTDLSGFAFPNSGYLNKRTQNISLAEGVTELNNLFRTDGLDTLTQEASSSETLFRYHEYISGSVENITTEFIVNSNYSFSYVNFYNQTNSDCVPVWTAYNTTCEANDSLITYFVDSNNCQQTPASNQTFGCDYGDNKVIGNSSTIQTSLAIEVYINSTLMNLTQNFSGNQKIEFRTENKTIIEGYWNFSSILNLKNISIEKGITSNRSYLIINGINMTKTIWLSRVSNATSVCVKNEPISSISEISSSCIGTNESLRSCPGTNLGIYCEVDGNYLKISGITNTAVIEYITAPLCNSDWNCTNFSICANQVQTRTCVDLNNCNDTYSRPVLNQSCSSNDANSCVSDWQCSEWSSCSKSGNQTRSCTDKNICNSAKKSRTETQLCEFAGKATNGTMILVVIWAVIVIAIIVVAFVIFYYVSKARKKPTTQDLNYYNNPSNSDIKK
ncbi:MAG: hypothetical protein WC979_08580 [Candidatus Pacearchaeota archaeon]